MNIMNHLTWKSMVKNRTRTIVTAIGISLAAALFCAVTTMGASILAYFIDLQIAVAGDYHVSATQLSEKDAEAIHSHEDVKSVAEAHILGVVNFYEQELGPNSGLIKACNAKYYETMPKISLLEGRLPQNSSELVIGEYLLHTMEAQGYLTEIGNEISLPVTPAVEALDQGDSSAPTFTITGTIVGILPHNEVMFPAPDQAERYSYIYTFLDESTPSPLYCDLYLKAANPYHAVNLATAIKGDVNYALLQYYGVAEAGNVAFVITAIMAAIIAIVMVGTVGLISNAFSVSVAQRTQQFGLLSSVGATRKQLRRSVRFEAGVLCLLGIPVGILLGFIVIVILLSTAGDTVEGMLATMQTGVQIKAVANPIALLSAAGITAGMVYLSAWRPSRRAALVTPMMAIRQETEYQINKNQGKTARKWWKPGRMSANMAAKYYQTNRKKYRSIIAALGISVVLFLSTTAVSTSLQHVAGNSKTDNFDFIVFIHSGDQDVLNQIRQHESVEQSALYNNDRVYCIIPEGSESSERKEAFSGFPEDIANMWRENPSSVYYLEDDVFCAFMQEQGIDPEPYFDKEHPLAAVFYQVYEAWEMRTDGKKNSISVTYPPFHDGVKELTYVAEAPNTEEYVVAMIKAQGYSDCIGGVGEYVTLEDGRIIFRDYAQGATLVHHPGGPSEVVAEGERQTFTFLAVEETDTKGNPITRFYSYDEKTGAVGSDVIAEQPGGSSKIGIGAQVDGVPFGIQKDAQHSAWLTLLRPLSALDQYNGIPAVSISTNNYPATKSFLDEISEDGRVLVYNDYLAEQFQMRQVSQLIDLFAYGFVTIMTLISLANIFNIVSTNILLRRKDIGMLRSLGMSNREIADMTIKEYAKCGVRALSWSLPIGLIVDYLVKRIIAIALTLEYVFPWVSFAIIVGSVVLVIGSSVAYALTCIRKDNPIDAIRMENI